MKQFILGISFVLLFYQLTQAQNALGINNESPSNKSALDVKGSFLPGGPQGVLIPRYPGNINLSFGTLGNSNYGLVYFDTLAGVYRFHRGGDVWGVLGDESLTGLGSVNTMPYWTGVNSLGSTSLRTNGSVFSMGIAPNPNYLLQVEHVSNFPAFYLRNSGLGEALWAQTMNVNGTAFRAVGTGLASNAALFLNGKVGIGTFAPTALLDVDGTSGVPNVKLGSLSGTGQRLVYAMDDGRLNDTLFSAFGGGWSLTGNTATDANLNYLGTTDSRSLRFRTNNIERFYIDSLNGSIGIGTRPGWITGAGKYLSLSLGDGFAPPSGVVSLEMKSRAAALSVPFARIDFIQHDVGITYNSARIEAISGASTTTHGQLGFFVSNGTLTERMRIAQNGNVGIGTTTPQVPRHVFGGNTTTIKVSNTATGINGGLNLYNDNFGAQHINATNKLIISNNNDFIEFAANGGGPGMKMDDGEVNIALNTIIGNPTSSPNVTLDVVGGFATRESSTSIVSGNNDAVPVGNGSFIVNTANLANIRGIANGKNGQHLIINNRSSSPMTIQDEVLAVTSIYRIRTGSGQDLVLPSNASAHLIYNSASSRWLVVSSSAQPSEISGTGLNNRVTYWTSANNLSFTGMVWDNANSRLGIGTPSPTTDLSFDGNTSKEISIERNSTLALPGSNLIISAGGAPLGQLNRGGGDLILSSGISTGSGGSNILFNTATGGTSGTIDRIPSTKMIITPIGTIGVGTLTPSYPYHINNATVPELMLQSTAGRNANNLQLGGLYFGDNNATSDQAGIYAFRDAAGGAGDLPTRLELRTTLDGGTTPTTRLVIKNDGNVGIGMTAPSERLEVSGSMTLNGEYKFSTPKTRYYSVASAAFINNYPQGYDMVKEASVGNAIYVYFSSGSGSCICSAPLNLPDSAIVTGLSAYMYRNEAVANNPTVRIVRIQNTSTTPETMATVSLTTNSTVEARLVSTATITSATILNNDYSYYLVFSTQCATKDTRLYSVRITYTVNKAE